MANNLDKLHVRLRVDYEIIVAEYLQCRAHVCWKLVLKCNQRSELNFNIPSTLYITNRLPHSARRISKTHSITISSDCWLHRSYPVVVHNRSERRSTAEPLCLVKLCFRISCRPHRSLLVRHLELVDSANGIVLLYAEE